jgi:eukaryotic-like serine/threonine-protein kinase
MPAEWEALPALFEGALARPKEERAAYLAEHTKDAALRREVESLLAAHESAGEFLSAPALGARPELPDDPGQPSRSTSGSARLTAGT